MVLYRNAQVISNSAFAGGTAYLRNKQSQRYTPGRTYSKVTTKRKGTYGMGKSFRKMVKQTEPARHYTYTSPISLVHNIGQTVLPNVGIVQGDTNINRSGDSISLCALKVRGFYNSSTTAGAYCFRILVGFTGEEYNLPQVFGSGLTVNEVFLPTTATNFAPMGIVNPKAFTCLYDEMIDVNSNIVATLDLKSFAFTVPLNDMELPFQADGSIYGKNKNLAIYVIAGVAGGTSGSTASGGATISYDLVFKN